MATSNNAYEQLYTNLKNRFTVVDGNEECTLGEYMLNRNCKEDSHALPMVTAAENTGGLSNSRSRTWVCMLWIRLGGAKPKRFKTIWVSSET